MTNSITAFRQSSPLVRVFRWLHSAFTSDRTFVSPETDEEEKLVIRAVHDPQAFDELYRRYVERVYAYHLVRTNSREEAEDLTSQTFLSALEGLSGYRRQGNFPAWLFSIARRKLIDHYRQPAALSLDMAGITGSGLEEAVDHKLRLQQVSRALLDIDPDRVEALSLRIFGQLTTAEISHILSRSEGAVRNLVYRALQDLRKHLVLETETEEK